MKKFIVLISGLMFLGAAYVFAQQEENELKDSPDGLSLIYKKEHITERKPISYQHVREADIMWSKVVWRIIDMREKINHPLYFPSEQIGTRKSLMQVLLDGIESGEIKAFSAGNDFNEFAQTLTIAEIEQEMGAGEKTARIEDPVTGEVRDTVYQYGVRTSEIKQMMVKEMWFFDRQRSVMEVRIIGLCPIRFFVPDGGEQNDLGDDYNVKEERKQVFWVKYPEARPLLARNEVFNVNNDAARISFDDVFQKRMFNGLIVKESNVFNNRPVNSYLMGIETILEAERIEDMIFQFHHDLWEY